MLIKWAYYYFRFSFEKWMWRVQKLRIQRIFYIIFRVNRNIPLIFKTYNTVFKLRRWSGNNTLISIVHPSSEYLFSIWHSFVVHNNNNNEMKKKKMNYIALLSFIFFHFIEFSIEIWLIRHFFTNLKFEYLRALIRVTDNRCMR